VSLVTRQIIKHAYITIKGQPFHFFFGGGGYEIFFTYKKSEYSFFGMIRILATDSGYLIIFIFQVNYFLSFIGGGNQRT